MKNFIVGTAVLLLILSFPLQFALEVYNSQRISRFSNIVYTSTQTARLEGYFTTTNIGKLKTELLDTFPDLSEADIYIDVTTTPKYRTNEFDEREAIYYDIRIPVRKIIAAAGFWGVSDADNQYMSQRKGFVLSEVLP